MNRALRNFAFFTAFATLCLICLGGLVTSHGVGMAVPDWPTTYGYNMFFFPISQWIGGVFYEHTHRLLASTVGLLTAILALWIWIDETTGKARRNGTIAIVAILLVVGGMMGVRTTPVFVTIALAGLFGTIYGIYRNRNIAGVRWYAMAALSAVIVQGVLGGLRVTQMKNEIGIFHATLAQLFFLLVAAIALYQTAWWKKLPTTASPDNASLRPLFVTTTVLILVQLMIAATMRHQHAGLAVPDFPLAYGKLWPATDAASVAAYNAHRQEIGGEDPITAFQIILHMIHRLVALAIFVAVATCAGKAWKRLGSAHPLTKGAFVWLALIVVQIGFGIATVLTVKAADIATAHVAIGAASLVTGGLLSMIAFRLLAPAGQKSLAPAGSSPFISNPVASSR